MYFILFLSKQIMSYDIIEDDLLQNQMVLLSHHVIKMRIFVSIGNKNTALKAVRKTMNISLHIKGYVRTSCKTSHIRL